MLRPTMCYASRFGTPFERGAIGFALVVCTLVVITLTQVEQRGPLEGVQSISYFIDDGEPGSGFRSGDEMLARWAFEEWSRASNGRLQFRPVSDENSALVRVRWEPGSGGQYGEMRPITVGGRQGAEVLVRPDTAALGPRIAAATRADPLLREAIVYLTCLHELGHAIGLSHSANYADVMFFFGHGGDILRFFGRYRNQLTSREDIPAVSGLSPGDVSRVVELYQ